MRQRLTFIAAIGCIASSSPALAELDFETRMTDCTGPRAHARAYSQWITQKCQEDGSCSEFSTEGHPFDGLAVCVEEALQICSVAGSEQGALCRAEIDAYLDDQFSKIDIVSLKAELEVFATEGKGLQRIRSSSALERLSNEDLSECAAGTRVLEPQLEPLYGPEGACYWSGRLLKLIDLQSLQRNVIRWQAQ